MKNKTKRGEFALPKLKIYSNAIGIKNCGTDAKTEERRNGTEARSQMEA